MNTEFTQGTWKVVSQMPNGYTIENEKGQVIAFLEDDAYENNDPNTVINDKEAYANAKLMATSSDMLSALKEAVDHAHVYDTSPALIELFKAVINKATN
jgi:hypothetical protein